MKGVMVLERPHAGGDTPKPIAARRSRSLMRVDQRGQFLAPVVLRGEQIRLVLAGRNKARQRAIDLATASNQPVPRRG
jgi:hypothetical protein